MARRSQCSSAGDNPLNPNYLPPHYREEYRLAIDALVEEDLEGYYQFLQKADVVDFLSSPEIQYIQDSVQAPQQSNQPEQRFLEIGGDGSSDTYWPIHSDLDAPGLDLGWPQIHHFIGPTEVTTLVNPPEPDMPSIKEQARRLIKNAHQVIAIAMDMFTDVDIFHDILNAAMRNVAVYILLDEQNAHHFINMVNNCRVNLQSIQFLRVRTVSGITYHCRSGKSFKGQMMDRFLLTDCRAVLSGNYSFMWSFEKLHRCMAHLFLGQLVTTFDEEFRILFAQSQPLIIENLLAPTEEFSLLPKRQYPSERTALYRESRKFLTQDAANPEEWARHSYDERTNMDWRLMPLKKKEPVLGPADMYSRFPSQHSRIDPSFDQGPTRTPLMENAAFKRHSYAEGVQGRYSFPFLPQKGMPEPEIQGKQFHRGQKLYPGAGNEADSSAYDKFWNQDFQSADQYSEPGLPQEMESPDFDPVLNYLSSTRNVDFDQGSEKLPAADLPFSSSHPRRLSLGQAHACQTSPTPSNPTEQKHFFQEPTTDRKDPVVKRGLRDWRISSYLSTYDNPEDEGLPLATPNVADPYDEPSNLIQQTAPGIDLSVPKIPNVREFKVPAIPRASQMPGYAKTTAKERPKKSLDEPTAVAAETKTTPSPSESSSTNEGEKTEEAEKMEPKTGIVHRDESFRRKYNAAVPRSSRLRSSLIFSSLEQKHTSQDTPPAPDQQDDESGKNEAEQTKEPFVSQVLGKRRSTSRGPFEWRSYIKSATFDNSATDTAKVDDENRKVDDKDLSKDENSKDSSEKCEAQESVKQPDVEQIQSSPLVSQSKPSDAELPKSELPKEPPKSLLTSPMYVDMNDPDMRLKFFKELAAKRKAAKAAEAEKSKEKVPMKPSTEPKSDITLKEEEHVPQETAEKKADSATSGRLSIKNITAEDVSGKANSQVRNDPDVSQSFKDQTTVSTDLEEKELKHNQPAATPPVSAEPGAPQSKPQDDSKLSNPAVKKSSPGHPSTPTNAAPVNVPSLAQGTDHGENPSLVSTSDESSLLTPSSVEVPPLSAFAVLDSITQNPESLTPETNISSSPLPSEKHTGSELNSHKQSVQSSSSDHNLPDSGSQISLSPSISNSSPLSSPVETISLNVSPKDPNLTSSTLFINVQETVSSSAESVEDTLQKSPASSVSQTESESTQANHGSVSQLTSPETPSRDDSTLSPGTHAAGSEPNTSSLQSTSKTDSEESCALTPSEKDSSVPHVVGKDSEDLGLSKDIKADCTTPSLNLAVTESCSPTVAALESKPKSPSEHSPVETSTPVHPDLTSKASLGETSAHDAPINVTPPCELNLTKPVSSSLAESISCSAPPTKLVLSPEAEKTFSTLHSPSDADSLPEQVSTDSNKTSSPTESTSKVPTEPCKTPESVTSGAHPSESPVPAQKSNKDNQNEVSQEPEMPDPSEKITDDIEAKNRINKATSQDSACSEEKIDQEKQNNCSEPPEVAPIEGRPPSPQSKQPKSSQSRYHTSTANVLSSSNLRDDTKLLLGQISANNQSRNESTKESPVTDDEKEDEADKKGKKEKEKGIRSLSRGQPKTEEDREKLLERIQSLRKERKVYSRFEMAP